MPLSLFLVSHFLDTKLGSFCAKLDDKVSPLDNYVLHINREYLNLNVLYILKKPSWVQLIQFETRFVVYSIAMLILHHSIKCN